MTTRYKPPKAPKPVRQVFGPFRGMRTVTEETASDPSLVQYALNMTCADPVNGGAYTVRPPSTVTSGMPGGICRFFHVLDTASATVPAAMSSTGELYVLQGATTWSRVVSATDFAGKSIALDPSVQTYYALPFAGKLIVSDGVNTPWSWDGTSGSGGLTLLSACPPLYGQPTEYAGKLFGIKAADHRTIVWSEENDPATGYEDSGFNNAWTISQQADTPLVAVHGRNDALYYWRTQGFGAISGAVAGEFRTTHTHDALSTTIGLAGPGAFADSGDALWWYSKNETICVYDIGGAVRDISPEITATHGDRITFAVDKHRWERSLTTSAVTRAAMAASRAALIGPNDVNDRAQVWFSLPGVVVATDGSFGADQQAILLIYDVATRRPLSWYARVASATRARCFNNLSAFASPDGRHGRFAIASDNEVNAPAFWHWLTVPQGPDENGTIVTGTLIGPAAGTDPMAEQTFLRLDAVCRVPAIETSAFGTLTLRPYTVTSTTPDSLSVTFGDPAEPFDSFNSNQRSPSNQHAVFGLEEVARTFRPVFTLQWTTHPLIGVMQGFGLERYSVLSSGITEEPDAY